MQNSIIETKELHREYHIGRDAVIALGGVDISIHQGEFVAIVGPSGCGKSTLLNLLGGLDQPTKGNVFLDGQNLAQLSEEQLAFLRRQKMGFIFQRHDLFPELTARENVEFPLLLGGMAPIERKKRAEDLLAQIGLAEKADHLPDELSGGQQQRVGIARALANNPLILLADEPTGNLDSATSAEIINILIQLTRNQGLTLVMVTHDPEVAEQADRKLTLRDGQIVGEKSYEIEGLL
jgi:putative ABC transport system ATP-binding protein